MIYGLVLDAGNQTRFNSKEPKSLQQIKGRSILDRNLDILKQVCDDYHVVINEEKKECYLLGHKSKKEFYEQCFFAKKGEIDYGKPFPVDCHNLQIDNIDKFKFDR